MTAGVKAPVKHQRDNTPRQECFAALEREVLGRYRFHSREGFRTRCSLAEAGLVTPAPTIRVGSPFACWVGEELVGRTAV